RTSRQRGQDALEFVAHVLEVRRQAEPLAERFDRLVGGEAGAAERSDLEQDTARLAEVDRLEVEPVDDRRRLPAGGDHALAPLLLLVGFARPGDVVYGPGTRQP